LRIGVDLGGTKIEGILLGPDAREIARRRVPTPRGDYAATLAAIRDLVLALEAGTGKATVGVGIPGAISPATGLVKNANSTWLIGKPFDRDLAEALARPVRVANDANCFVQSEAMDGAAEGADTVFGVILGTGCGGGLMINGQLVTGAHAIAGEWGHNPLPWPTPDEYPGPACYCGKHGCVETWIAGPGLARDCDPKGDVTAEEVVSRASRGDAAAKAALARHADRVGGALATVINLVDPEIIVFGGGLSNLDGLCATVGAHLPRYVFSDRVATELVRGKHGDSSGVRGAAWLWPESAALALAKS